MIYAKKFQQFLPLLMMLLVSSAMFGQINLQNISVSMASEQEILKGLEAKSITDQVRGDLRFDYDNMEFGKDDIYSMACENPTFRIGTTLPMKGSGLSLYVGANVIWDRYDGAYYRTNEENHEERSTLHFSSWTNEITLESSILKKIQLPIFNVYVGAGANMGYSFGGDASIEGTNVKVTQGGDILKGETPTQGDMFVIEQFNDNYNLKNSVHSRVFLQAGVGIRIFKMFEVGLEGKLGYGMRLTKGAATQGTKLSALGLNAKFLF